MCEGDEPYAIRGLISAGVGIGLMPAMARRLAPDPPVGGSPRYPSFSAPSPWRTLSLVWRADAYQPAAARALVEFGGGDFPHLARRELAIHRRLDSNVGGVSRETCSTIDARAHREAADPR